MHLLAFVEWRWFDNFIFFVLMNFLALACYQYRQSETEGFNWFCNRILDRILTAFFTVELVLKVMPVVSSRTKNPWGSGTYLFKLEWGQIFVILAIFIASGKLLSAVLAGIILTCTGIILTHANMPCVTLALRKGAELSSKRQSQILTETALHVENEWMLTVRLKGLAFFASAQALMSQLRDVTGGRAALEVASAGAVGGHVPAMA